MKKLVVEYLKKRYTARWDKLPDCNTGGRSTSYCKMRQLHWIADTNILIQDKQSKMKHRQSCRLLRNVPQTLSSFMVSAYLIERFKLASLANNYFSSSQLFISRATYLQRRLQSVSGCVTQLAYSNCFSNRIGYGQQRPRLNTRAI